MVMICFIMKECRKDRYLRENGHIKAIKIITTMQESGKCTIYLINSTSNDIRSRDSSFILS